MGLTHYWHINEPRKVCFDALVEDARRIIVYSPVVVCDGLGRGKPTLNTRTLSFNGSEKLGEDYETFEIDADSTGGFCKTGERPYDAVVMAVLIAAKEHYGDGIVISSDATWDEWKPGRDLYRQALGRKTTPRKVLR